MDLTYPPDAEEFRVEVRGWLEENLPEGWFDEGFEMTSEERKAFNRGWTAKLHEGNWLCASWPTEYGGRGLPTMHAVVLAEEFHRSGAPMRADFFGDTLVGPTILQWGTEEQKQEFIPKILSGEISWCQGFSEPDAGSDLAGLKTRAELENELLALELTTMRVAANSVDGKPHPASSVLKLKGSELQQAVTELVVDLAGPASLASGASDDSALPLWTRHATPTYLNFRKASIYGGSNEVQRQIIARTILGL